MKAESVLDKGSNTYEGNKELDLNRNGKVTKVEAVSKVIERRELFL